MASKNECKGLLFRASVSSFAMIGGKRQYFQAGVWLGFLKKKSCPGCEHCFWMWEATSEQMYNAKELNPQDFHNGSIYSLKCEGDLDDFEMYFDRVESSFGKRIPQTTTISEENAK